jgi:hypothetical protein
MKRNVIVFGLISGFIVSAFMAISMAMLSNQPDFEGSMVVGYAAMIVAFSFVFIGIKNFRDKYCNGVINFGQAFKVGLYITLIASTMYVGVWLIEYYFFMPDFMEKYSAHVMKSIQESGATQAEIDKKILEMQGYKDMYKNPLFVILLTYMEILPVGILITIISALILKRKTAKTEVEMAG